jgi:hypothetical protein
MRFKGKTLTGVWTCERCGDLARPLQICPLTDGFRCPGCGNPLVFVPDFRPVETAEGLRLFAEMKKQIIYVETQRV